jgi:hypothetical protein
MDSAKSGRRRGESGKPSIGEKKPTRRNHEAQRRQCMTRNTTISRNDGPFYAGRRWTRFSRAARYFNGIRDLSLPDVLFAAETREIGRTATRCNGHRSRKKTQPDYVKTP